MIDASNAKGQAPNEVPGGKVFLIKRITWSDWEILSRPGPLDRTQPKIDGHTTPCIVKHRKGKKGQAPNEVPGGKVFLIKRITWSDWEILSRPEPLDRTQPRKDKYMHIRPAKKKGL